MIFNTEVFFNSGLNGEEFVTLLIIKNKDYEKLDSFIREIGNLNAMGYIDYITTGKKSDPDYKKARLSKKAKNFLRDLQIPGITEDIKELAATLMNLYEQHGCKERIGNRKAVVRLTAWFVTATGMESPQETILPVVDEYLTSTPPTYVSMLENLIWKAPNMFTTKPDLENSKLDKLIKKAHE